MKFMRLLCVAVASVKMALTGIASFTGGVVMAAVTPAGEVPTEIPPGTKFGLVDNGRSRRFSCRP